MTNNNQLYNLPSGPCWEELENWQKSAILSGVDTEPFYDPSKESPNPSADAAFEAGDTFSWLANLDVD